MFYYNKGMPLKLKKKKHVNANKIHYDGYDFDSTLEYEFYFRAKLRGLNVEVKPETVQLIPPFQFGQTIKGSKHHVSDISYTYDFRIGHHRIETKGRLMKDAAIRIKLYKWHLYNTEPSATFWMPRNIKDIEAVLDIIQGIKPKKPKKVK